MEGKIKIVLVDDHAMLRGGLTVQINAEPDMEVVGGCTDADSAIDLVVHEHPDIVLMDIDLPGLNCFAACRTILSQRPETRVVFLSAYSHDSYIDQAIGVHAWGYVTKGENFEVVRDAIRAVAGGRVHYSDDIKSRLVAHEGGFRLATDTHSRGSTLSPRELEVLRYLAQGISVKEVAKIMHLSAKTVDNHKSNIMSKLDIHDRVALARFAFREGIAAF